MLSHKDVMNITILYMGGVYIIIVLTF